MRPFLDKESCLHRAESLVAAGRPEALRYACLELRFCLEAIAYDKLRVYSKRVPVAVLNTWQPPQAIKALLDYEPLADKSFVLRRSREGSSGEPDGEWKRVGVHNALGYSLVRKYYNKLGSFLHIPSPVRAAAVESVEPTSGELLEIIGAIREAAASRFDTNLAPVVEWKCAVCEAISVSNISGLKKSLKAVCQNPNCGAAHAVQESADDKLLFTLAATVFECHSCKAGIPLENRNLGVGLKFRCKACGLEHEILAREWEYGSNAERPSDGV